MTKYIRVDFPEPSQSKISDELAALWIGNGNTGISDTPWPGLPIVPSYFVTDGPAQDHNKEPA